MRKLAVKRFTAYHDILWHSYQNTYHDTENFIRIHIISVWYLYSIIIRLLLRNLSISKNSIYYIIEMQIVSWGMYWDTLHIVHIISPQDKIYFVQLHHIMKLTHNSLKCETSPFILRISSMSTRYGHECMIYNGQMGHVNMRPDKPCWSCRHSIISFKSVQDCVPVHVTNVAEYANDALWLEWISTHWVQMVPCVIIGPV